MDLVIGGAFQGKLSWAAQEYQLRPEELCDLACTEVQEGKRCYFHLEALTRCGADAAQYLPLLCAADVVISREVGSGVVPMDAGEREWREKHGVLLQELARRAVHVRRVFCGLTEELK